MQAFAKSALQDLINLLWEAGYEVIGPRLGEGAIVYGPVKGLEQLPKGWIEEQEGGRYRLQRDPEARYFGYTVGPQSWKAYLHPPELCLFKTTKQGDSFTIAETDVVTRRAFLGVKACELAAIAKQDNVFLGQEYRDPWYQDRRESVFLIGVNCSRASSTCFCESMNTGPVVSSGDQMTITELPEVFLAEARTDEAREYLQRMDTREPTSKELNQMSELTERARSQMGRRLTTQGLPELLKSSMDHPRWQEVADRCLSCSNCTMVCPTCFCFTVDEVTELKGDKSERVRRWDSCFTNDFTYTSGSVHRQTTRSKYRHWMTHKLATWHDQFDESGCVGCGRCITWCPVGIDITEEAALIRGQQGV